MRIKELRKDRSQQNRLFLIEGASDRLIVVEAKAKSSGFGFDVVGASESYTLNKYFADIVRISKYDKNEQGAVFSLFDHTDLESETFQRKTTNFSQEAKDEISNAIERIRGIDEVVEFGPQEQPFRRNIRRESTIPNMTRHQRPNIFSRAGRGIGRFGRRGRAEVTAFTEQGTGPGGEYTPEDQRRLAAEFSPEILQEVLLKQYKMRQNVPGLAQPITAWVNESQAMTAEDVGPKKTPQEVAKALRIMMKLHRDLRKSRAFKMKTEQREALNAQVKSVLGENRQAAQEAVNGLEREEIANLLRDHYTGRSMKSPRGTSASKINTRVEEALALFDYLAGDQVARNPQRSEMNYIYKKPAFDALSGRYKPQSIANPEVNHEAAERDRAEMMSSIASSGNLKLIERGKALSRAEQGRSELGRADMIYAGSHNAQRRRFQDQEFESVPLPNTLHGNDDLLAQSRRGTTRRLDSMIQPVPPIAPPRRRQNPPPLPPENETQTYNRNAEYKLGRASANIERQSYELSSGPRRRGGERVELFPTLSSSSTLQTRREPPRIPPRRNKTPQRATPESQSKAVQQGINYILRLIQEARTTGRPDPKLVHFDFDLTLTDGHTIDPNSGFRDFLLETAQGEDVTSYMDPLREGSYAHADTKIKKLTKNRDGTLTATSSNGKVQTQQSPLSAYNAGFIRGMAQAAQDYGIELDIVSMGNALMIDQLLKVEGLRGCFTDIAGLNGIVDKDGNFVSAVQDGELKPELSTKSNGGAEKTDVIRELNTRKGLSASEVVFVDDAYGLYPDGYGGLDMDARKIGQYSMLTKANLCQIATNPMPTDGKGMFSAENEAFHKQNADIAGKLIQEYSQYKAEQRAASRQRQPGFSVTHGSARNIDFSQDLGGWSKT